MKWRWSLVIVGAILVILGGFAGVASAQTQTFYGCLTATGTLKPVSTVTVPTFGVSVMRGVTIAGLWLANIHRATASKRFS